MISPLANRILTAALCALALLAPAPASAQTTTPKTIYVAPTGSDGAAGTADAPLATVGAALARAAGGDRIQLAAGSYPLVKDQVSRTADVTIVGQGPDTTQIAGLQITGGQHLSFHQIKFTAPVVVQGHPVTHAAQPAASIELDNAEFTSSSTCVTIREGAQDITVTDSRIHDCYSGIVGPGNPYMSRRIQIERNTIERLKSDAIQFGSWSDVRIADNRIQDVLDPNGVIHNDGIQLTGNSANVLIEANTILRSNGQLVFIQDAIGPLDNVDVINNVLSGSKAVALQSQGATGSSFVNNTVWNAKDGGIWFGRGYWRNGVSVVPKDTVVSNNVSTTMRYLDGATAGAAAGNVVLTPGKYSGLTVPPGATSVTDMGFANAAGYDYRLLATSAARGRGSALALPPTDIVDAVRTGPVPGAHN